MCTSINKVMFVEFYKVVISFLSYEVHVMKNVEG